jgi:DNA-directed RNA polymerase delta subunit
MPSNKTTVTKAQLDKLIADSLELLKKDRDREILLRRYGIATGKTQTLEQIGQDLGITRERVRQIEKAAMIKIREQFNHDHQLNDVLVAITDQRGGIIGFASLVAEVGNDDKLKPHLSFLVKLNPRFRFLDRNDRHSDVLFLTDMYKENDVLKLHDELIAITKRHGKPLKFDKIAQKTSGTHKKEALMELATVSNEMSNLESIWGLSVWPEVNPKSIRDKIYLILKKGGRPMHFTEIATRIADLKANPKKVTTQAVHNELIKDGRFVLIGRGIYALGEWGYQAGTVADIIEEVLREQSPLAKAEIISRVLARRQVKTTTITLNLQEKDQFERVEKGMYQLKPGYVPEKTTRRTRGGRKPASAK